MLSGVLSKQKSDVFIDYVNVNTKKLANGKFSRQPQQKGETISFFFLLPFNLRGKISAVLVAEPKTHFSTVINRKIESKPNSKENKEKNKNVA